MAFSLDVYLPFWPVVLSPVLSLSHCPSSTSSPSLGEKDCL